MRAASRRAKIKKAWVHTKKPDKPSSLKDEMWGGICDTIYYLALVTGLYWQRWPSVSVFALGVVFRLYSLNRR